MKCRMCRGKNLYCFLDLGHTPLADEFKRPEQLLEPETYYPLQIFICDDCGLAQLGRVVSPEVLYQNDYPYESSTTKAGREHWDRFAKSTVKRFNLSSNDLVVDIGSNAGVLLSAFQKHGVRIQGIDPAPNIAKIANDNGIDTVCDFFNTEAAKKIIGLKGHASIITGTNVFAHVDDLHAFVESVRVLLKKDGKFILEVPHFANLIRNIEYDTIYHEHLSYISMKPLVQFLKEFDMEVFDVEQVDFHGGSIRVFIGKNSQHVVSERVEDLLSLENSLHIYSHVVLDSFADAVRKNRNELLKMLYKIKLDGKKIVAVSAPAKGMTLLNYCKIGNELISFITEKSQLKIGKFTPGGHIAVVPDEMLLEVQPDYALLLAWNFADEIIKNLNEYRGRGGKFIIPIPAPHVVD